MQQMMSDLEKDYDLIVYDAAPLVGLADTTRIAPHTDGVVVVARVNKCDRDVLGYVTENIRFAKVPVLGMVANGVIPDGKSYKYYAYGYGTQQQPTPPHNNGNNGAGNSSKKGLDLASFTKYRK